VILPNTGGPEACWSTRRKLTVPMLDRRAKLSTSVYNGVKV